MAKKVKIAIIAALALAGALAFAQQISTFQCAKCGRIIQTASIYGAPRCGCGGFTVKRGDGGPFEPREIFTFQCPSCGRIIQTTSIYGSPRCGCGCFMTKR